MKMPFDQNSLVKDIVNLFPQSSDLFKKNRLDFCCGGNRPLAEAADEQNINVPAIMAELKIYIKNITELLIAWRFGQKLILKFD